MRFTCPSCSKSYRLPPERLGAAGKAQISCPNCKSLVIVRAGEGEVLDCRLAAANESSAVIAEPALRPVSSSVQVVEASWYVVIGREKQGPMPPQGLTDMLASGAISAQTLVWQKGMTAWTKLGEVAQLAGLLPAAPAARAAASQAVAAPQPTAAPQAAAAPQPGAAPRPTAPQPVAIAVQASPTPAARPAPAAVVIRPQVGAAPSVAPARTPSQQPQQVAAIAPSSQASSPGVAASTPGQPSPLAGGPGSAAANFLNAARASASAMPAGQGGSQPGVARPQPKPMIAVSKTPGGQPTPIGGAKPPTPRDDLDDSGPTMQANVIPPAKAAPQLVKNSGLTKLTKDGAGRGNPSKISGGTAAETHGNAFFNTGHDLQDVELMMPDANKHKPTKEEYQNLLQEFSVMFRLDKRSKRQKVAIGVVMTSLVVGVVAFGAVLHFDGESKKALLHDAKTILAVFNLQYQNSMTVQLGDDEPAPVAVAPGQVAPKAENKPVQTQEVSDLSAQLQKIIHKRKPKPVAAVGAMVVNSGPAAPKLSKEEQAQLEAAQAAAVARALGSKGGKVEKLAGVAGGEGPTAGELNSLCHGLEGDFRACGQTAGAGGFKVKFIVETTGNCENISAIVDGKADSGLTACVGRKLGKKRLSRPAAPINHTCTVD